MHFSTEQHQLELVFQPQSLGNVNKADIHCSPAFLLSQAEESLQANQAGPIFIIKVLLEAWPAHLFRYCPGCCHSPTSGLNSWDTHTLGQEAKNTPHAVLQRESVDPRSVCS